MKTTEFSMSEIRKVTETIKTKLINSRKHRIEFHRSYSQYPNKINTLKATNSLYTQENKTNKGKPTKEKVMIKHCTRLNGLTL